MKTLNFFRKSRVAFTLSIVMFTVSCTQYDINNSDVSNQSFDFSIYEDYKNNPFKINISNNLNFPFLRTTNGDINYAILQDINEQYETNIVLADDFLDLHLDMTSHEIKTKSLQLGYVSQQDIDLMDDFFENLKKDDFNSAIADFESDVVGLNLSNEEFEHYSKFANYLKILNDEIDFNDYANRGLLACLSSIVAFLIAAYNLWHCLRPTRCVMAFVAYIIAGTNVAINCSEE